MFKSKNFIYFSVAFLVAGLLFVASLNRVLAESRYLAQKYSFSATGSLVNPLELDFGGITKTIYMDKKQIEKDRALLLVAFPLNSTDIFAKQLFDSETYSIYKVRLRDNNKEELVILGLSESDSKKVKVTEIYIIGKDVYGGISAMSVKSFKPVTVLNTPLQLDGNRSIVLPLDGSGKLMRIYWDNVDGNFVAGLSENPDKTTSDKTLDNSYSETTEGQF